MRMEGGDREYGGAKPKKPTPKSLQENQSTFLNQEKTKNYCSFLLLLHCCTCGCENGGCRKQTTHVAGFFFLPTPFITLSQFLLHTLGSS